jgi:hypothetical protein
MRRESASGATRPKGHQAGGPLLTLAALAIWGCASPAALSDAERVWCDGNPKAVLAAILRLNIPEPAETNNPEISASWHALIPMDEESRERWNRISREIVADFDAGWLRGCKAAFEGR